VARCAAGQAHRQPRDPRTHGSLTTGTFANSAQPITLRLSTEFSHD
jgi:hypothetical protein